MIQSLDFIYWIDKHPEDRARILDAISNEEISEIVVDRYRMAFDPSTRYVTVDKASENVPFAGKIIKCRMSFDLMQQMVSGTEWDMSSFEYLYDDNDRKVDVEEILKFIAERDRKMCKYKV